jgi:hypothetical protein
MDALLPVNASIEANAVIARLTDRGRYLTRHNRLYVVGTLALIGGGLVSIMFFNTALILLGCGIIAAVLDVRRRAANDSARWLGQHRRALESCANDASRWRGQTRCTRVGCVAERTCGLRNRMTELG